MGEELVQQLGAAGSSWEQLGQRGSKVDYRTASEQFWGVVSVPQSGLVPERSLEAPWGAKIPTAVQFPAPEGHPK